LLIATLAAAGVETPVSESLERWFTPQAWERDVNGPIVSLGEPGDFDDTHLFAPMVIQEDGSYSLYYCGSTADVANRVFQVGLSTGADGRAFTKHPDTPVYAFGDGKHSVLTPTILRNTDGTPRREDGKLRMWFAASHFAGGTGLHALHEATSVDGITWSAPSPPQLDHAYAPSIIWDAGMYRMWYSDVSEEPWVVRHAQSLDGREWRVTEEPCVVIDQDWEQRRLFYPTVVKTDGVYLMWYGSYWKARDNMTALGLAVSTDGITWHKNPHNPVFTPDPDRPWESHYTTSQTLHRDAEGRWRIWYATRKAPPHVNKYFAIGTATWQGPKPVSEAVYSRRSWVKRKETIRKQMAETLVLKPSVMDVEGETHRAQSGDGFVVESVTYVAEPGSRVTALLYTPTETHEKLPAVVLACGHGGSKSALYAQYAGQLYAKMGFACLAVDTIGEEERNIEGGMGTRAHDLYRFKDEERLDFVRNKLKRSVLGKIVLDLRRGIDYLETRPDIDVDRIGIMGYSLGGTSAGCLAVLDERVRAAIICGWGLTDLGVSRGKHCSRLPYEEFATYMNFDEMHALLAPHAPTLFLSGTHDAVIDLGESGSGLMRKTYAGIHGAKRILAQADVEGRLDASFIPDADHRPLFLTAEAVAWFQEHLMTETERRPVPEATVHFGTWVESQGRQIERLYNTEARERGTQAVDIGAVYYDPKVLACFPDADKPDPLYTFEGWVDTVLAGNAQ
jgi:dienelactone hydrolase